MDFEKKHQEDLQRLRGFRLLDDDFMTKVFEDIQCAELLLRIILNDEGIHVLEVHSQRGIKNLQGRSVRLDILAIDSHDRVFNDFCDTCRIHLVKNILCIVYFPGCQIKRTSCS